MTTITKKPLYESTTSDEITSAPFIKFGIFDSDNYKPSELAKAKENEDKYQPLRLLAGDKIEAGIADVTKSKFGDVLQLVDATIIRGNDKKVKSPKDTESEFQLGVSAILKNKLAYAKKSIGDTLVLEYLGLHPSDKDPSKKFHKFNVS